MNGKCCRNLGILVSPEKLKKSYQNWVNGKSKFYSEIYLLYPMLEFLYCDKIHPNGNIEVREKIYHYSCKHLDKKTSKCKIYDIRPMMCRTFPTEDGTSCMYKNCSCGTFEDKK